MNHKHVIPAAIALSLAAAGLAQAQGSGGSTGTVTTTNSVGTGTSATNGSSSGTGGNLASNSSNTADTPAGHGASLSNPQVGNPNINTSVGHNPSPNGDKNSNNAVSTSSQNTTGAPHPGANSFTEGQARSRIQDHGFSQVTDLKLDNQGVWRGTAMRDGKRVSVAMDYQGNVTGQ